MENVDFTLYDNTYDMLGYIGFITPEGKYYRVRKYNDEEDMIHPTWCELYLKTLQVNFLTKLFADPYIYVIRDLHYLIIIEDTKNNSIDCVLDKSLVYNDLQMQKFYELKELYDKEYTIKR